VSGLDQEALPQRRSGGTVPGVAARESGMKMLNAEQVRRYHDNGFVFPFHAVSADVAARYRADVERTCGGSLSASPLGPSYRVKPFLLFTWAASLVREPAVLNAVEDLIGPDILVFHTTLWWKPKGSTKRVPWHQDATYFGLAPFEHVTAWVALSPSNLQTGCVRIIPGTHRDGQLPHADRADPALMLSRGQTVVAAFDEARAEPMVLSPGEFSLHHTLSIHASDPNIGDDDRSGRETYGHFDLEPAPVADLDPTAVAAHADSNERFWTASKSIPEMALIH
jgi:non-heme Fe2+,alpha-ketoglutarate-dependent halogenase